MLIKYRFSINGYYVNPIWPADLSKEYELESQQRFFRQNLSGKLSFIKDDYDWLKAQAFDTEFELLIEKSNDAGSTWSIYWEGVFFKTDADPWNDDDKIVTVKPDVKDGYTEVLALMESEYNLIKLAPGMTEIEIQKRPMVQIYVPGSNVVGCFLSGNFWEQDTAFEESDTTELTDTYFFRLTETVNRGVVSGSGTPIGCAGDYVSEGAGAISPPAANSFTLVGKNSTYKITYVPGSPTPGGYPYTLSLIRESDSVVLFSYSSVTDEGNLPLDEDIVLTAVGGGATGTFIFNWGVIEVYARLLNDVEGVGSELPTEDLVTYNRNYKRAWPYDIANIIVSSETQIAPSEYGLANDGEYFVEPTIAFYKSFPINRSLWTNTSLWYMPTPGEAQVEEEYRKAYILKHGSMISEVIRVLLEQVDSSLSHDGTSDYSEFLYGTINPITFNAFRVMITQKTNITTGEFDNPAQKAPITLASVLTMLRDTFQLYWYVEDSKLKIEHISWFKNGGSYSVSLGIGADLTTLLDTRIKKEWGFESSKWNYDKQELAERIEFAWMDDVTLAFDGYPIEINSKFVQRGKIDEVNVGDYTSDVDYMLLNPLAINKDGFALMAVVENVNIFDVSDAGNSIDYYINLGGNLQALAGYNSSDYIEINSNSEYLFKNTFRFAWYDSSNIFISLTTPVGQIDTIERSPSNAKYVRACTTSANWSVMYVGSTIQILPFIQRNVDGSDLEMQNGYCSWIYLHPNYWTYDLPSDDVRINDSESVTVEGIKRGKKQEVSYPSVNDPEEMKLIKTYLGNGEIEKLSVNLSTRMNKITLKYDTE